VNVISIGISSDRISSVALISIANSYIRLCSRTSSNSHRPHMPHTLATLSAEKSHSLWLNTQHCLQEFRN